MLTVMLHQYHPTRMICRHTTPRVYFLSILTLRNETQLLLNTLAVDEAIDQRLVKECGGGSSFLATIPATATQATAHTTKKRGKGESPCQLKMGSRGWCYKAGLALLIVEKDETNVDRAEF